MQLTEPSPDLLSGVASSVLIAIGVFLLRIKQQNARTEELRTFPFAWMSITTGFFLLAASCGAVRGILYALLVFALSGFAAVASNIALRTSPLRGATSLSAEPEIRPTNWRRAPAKALLAIVLAGIAAFGIGEAFAVAMPIEATNRIVIGGLMIPVLWGGGMAWTLADAKLARAAIALVGIAAVAFAIAFLPKVLS